MSEDASDFVMVEHESSSGLPEGWTLARLEETTDQRLVVQQHTAVPCGTNNSSAAANCAVDSGSPDSRPNTIHSRTNDDDIGRVIEAVRELTKDEHDALLALQQQLDAESAARFAERAGDRCSCLGASKNIHRPSCPLAHH